VTNRILFLVLLLVAAPAWANGIECTESAVHAEIARINSNCDGVYTGACQPNVEWCKANGVLDDGTTGVTCCTGKNTGTCDGSRDITFNCSNTTITFDVAADAGVTSRSIEVDFVSIDGESNNITVEASPRWGTDPNDDGVPWFVQFKQVYGGGVKHLTVRQFDDGVRIRQSDATVVDGLIGEDNWDESYGIHVNYPSGYGHVLKNSTFREGIDKCVSLSGEDGALDVTDEQSMQYWNVQLLNNSFESCNNAHNIKYEGGRFLLDGNTYTDVGSQQSQQLTMGSPGDSQHRVLYVTNMTVNGVERGLRIFGNNTKVKIYGTNTIKNNGKVGICVFDQARVLVEGIVLQDNGGEYASDGCVGGIAVQEGAIVDAGGGSITIDGTVTSSAGNNQFLNNAGGGDPTLDINNTTTTTIKAEGNWWGSTSGHDAKTEGSVDYEPFLGEEPAGNTGVLPAPQNVRRVDVAQAGGS
jgi:hypothetical protein